MKKLLTIIAFCIANTVVLQAQDSKPTKEETIAFIRRTVEVTIGMPVDLWRVTEVNFSSDSYRYKSELLSSAIIREYSLIKWENLITDKWGTIISDGTKRVGIIAYFSSNIKYTENFTSGSDKTEYVGNISVIIPIEKFESIKKAFLRLAEIAKEENKDPFANQ